MDDELKDRLLGRVAQVLGPRVALPDPFPFGQQLSELGLSSLKMVNLMLAIEIEFDIAIPPADITPETFQSLATIATLVERLLSLEPSTPR